MTQEEQNRLISDMVKERNSLRRERALLNEQVGRSKNGMRDASEAANLASQGNYERVQSGFNYQDAEAFTVTLQRLGAIDARLEELDQRLDACC